MPQWLKDFAPYGFLLSSFIGLIGLFFRNQTAKVGDKIEANWKTIRNVLFIILAFGSPIVSMCLRYKNPFDKAWVMWMIIDACSIITSLIFLVAIVDIRRMRRWVNNEIIHFKIKDIHRKMEALTAKTKAGEGNTQELVRESRLLSQELYELQKQLR